MNRVFIKNTSRFPQSVVDVVVAFARDGRETGNVAMPIKNSSRSFRGRAYGRVPRISPFYGKGYDYLAVIAIGAESHYPKMQHQYPRLKTAPVYDINDSIEALVLVVAHELQHCEQFKMKRALSEIEAERVAVKTLERFRAARAGLDIDMYCDDADFEMIDQAAA